MTQKISIELDVNKLNMVLKGLSMIVEEATETMRVLQETARQQLSCPQPASPSATTINPQTEVDNGAQ